MKEETCANCGKMYSQHILPSTSCFEGQEGKWFPVSIAYAIIKTRQEMEIIPEGISVTETTVAWYVRIKTSNIRRTIRFPRKGSNWTEEIENI